jgi:hypothetical protein
VNRFALLSSPLWKKVSPFGKGGRGIWGIYSGDRSMRSINLFCLIILFATILLNANAFSQEFIRVVDSNGTEILNIQSISLEDNQYLLINDLLTIFKTFDERQKVKFFDAKQRYIPLTQKLTLEFKNNKKISFVINQTTVIIEGREATTESLENSSAESYTLSKPPALIYNIPALPKKLFTQILSKFL